MRIDTIIKKILRKTRIAGNIREISYDCLKDLLRCENNAILIDVRSPQEFAEGKLTGAINIPWYDIQKKANFMFQDKNATMILYCQSGERSKKACKLLARLGFTNLYNLEGGLDDL